MIVISKLLEEKQNNIHPPELQAFADICKFDGSLIPIPNIKSLTGEELFISTRYSIGDERRSYLSIDVVANRDGKYIPVGMKDYEIKEGLACGNKQRHDKHSHDSEVASIVDQHWVTGEGFRVTDTNLLKYAEQLTPGKFDGMDIVRQLGLISEGTQGDRDWMKQVYKGRGLGHLMTAVSVVALRYLDIGSIKTISLSNAAKHIWRKFGVGEGEIVDMDEIVQSEEIMNSIRKSLI